MRHDLYKSHYTYFLLPPTSKLSCWPGTIARSPFISRTSRRSGISRRCRGVTGSALLVARSTRNEVPSFPITSGIHFSETAPSE